MFGKRKKQVVGCDVGSSAIKIVELKPLKNDEFQLVHAAVAELSPEAIVDGAIMDSSLVVEALSRLIAENNIKNANFGGSLSGHSVIIKKIQLPSMTDAELAESIQWEAEQYIPFDINDVNLDFEVLADDEEGAGEGVAVVSAGCGGEADLLEERHRDVLQQYHVGLDGAACCDGGGADVDGVETPAHLNAVGQWLADNVFHNQDGVADIAGNDTRGLWCTNCHTQLGQEIWAAEDCNDLINGDCVNNVRGLGSLSQIASAIGSNLAEVESWLDPKDNIHGTTPDGIDHSHRIWDPSVSDAPLATIEVSTTGTGASCSPRSRSRSGVPRSTRCRANRGTKSPATAMRLPIRPKEASGRWIRR